MDNIGGNVTCTLLAKKGNTKNKIGENTQQWEEYKTILGYLDFASQTSNRVDFKAKIEEATHVFICDYIKIEKRSGEIKAIINDKEYEVLYIDNPMELNEHLEFYLKCVGT